MKPGTAVAFGIIVLGMLYIGYQVSRTDYNFQQQMHEQSLLLSRYERKAQWIQEMLSRIQAEQEIATTKTDLMRMLSATWEYCEMYDFPRDIMLAVARKESQFNSRARGSDGEIGMFQIMPETAILISRAYNLPIYKEEDVFDIENNALIAILYLKDLERMYGLKRALAHYNHGRQGLGIRGQEYARDVIQKAGAYAVN